MRLRVFIVAGDPIARSRLRQFIADEGGEIVGESEAVEAHMRRGDPTDEDLLTGRQREVLRLLALGHTNQEAAEALGLSVRTVETHRAHVMQKLRISSRAELVRYALEHGLFDNS